MNVTTRDDLKAGGIVLDMISPDAKLLVANFNIAVSVEDLAFPALLLRFKLGDTFPRAELHLCGCGDCGRNGQQNGRQQECPPAVAEQAIRNE